MAFTLAPQSRTLTLTHERAIIPTLEPKDPDDVKQYVWDLGGWLDEEGTTLVSFAVAIDSPAAPTLTQTESATSDAVVSPATPGRNVCAWFGAGTLDKDYLVRLRGVTSLGQTFDASFWLPVRRR